MSTETHNEALNDVSDELFNEQASQSGGVTEEAPVEATENESEDASALDMSTAMDDIEQAFAELEDDAEETPKAESKPNEKEEAEETSEESKDEFNIDELLASFEEKQKELEVEKKRRADTQSDRQRQINKMNKMVEKLVEDGRISAEEAQAYRSVDDGADVLNRIQKRFERDKEILGSIFEDGDLDNAVDAFSMLGLMDPEIRDELMELPEHKTSAFIVRKGKELQPLAEQLSEHGGSIVKALQATVSGEKTQKVAKAAYDKGYQEAKAYFEDKFKDYVSPSKGRPSLDSSVPSKKTDSLVDEDVNSWGLPF